MKSRPLISAIIPTYQNGAYVVEAVESVLAQTYEAVEVVVVDDGSTDDTEERLAPVRDRIRHIRQANGGPAKARNRGAQESRGELIAFLDADDRWLPEKLERQVRCLEAAPVAGLVHTDICRLDQATGSCERGTKGREQYVGDCYARLFWRNGVATSSVLVRRGAFDAAGGFDESFRGAATEDLDLWLRVAKRHAFAFVDEALTVYRVHSGNSSGQVRCMMEYEFAVHDKALRADPELVAQLGRRPARERVAKLAFEAGYSNAEYGDLSRARTFFWKSLTYQPWSSTAMACWLSTWVPVELRNQLRSIKRELVRDSR